MCWGGLYRSGLLGVVVLFANPVFAQTSDRYPEAEALVRQGHPDAAIPVLWRLIRREPRNLKAHNLLGIAETARGDFAAADEQFHFILNLDANFYPALKNLATSELAQNKISAAEKHFRAALSLVPNDPIVHAGLGKIAYARKDYRAAAEEFRKVPPAETQPNLVAMLVESQLRIGEREMAVRLLADVNPKELNSRSQFNLGFALAESGLAQQAIPFFALVSADHPDSYDAAFNLAICYVATKQFPAAISTLRKVADGRRESAELDNLLAEAYLGNNETQNAIDTLRAATQLAPQDEDNYVDLVTLCTGKEAYNLALEIVQIGLRHHPNSDRLIFQRGVIEAMTSHFEAADRDFELASTLAPEKNLSYVALGISYMQRGNTPEAIAKLRSRLQEKPNDATLLYLLGDALIRAGARAGQPEFTEAKSALEKSVELDPRLPASRIDLGKLYLQEGRLEQALAQLEAARTLDPKAKAAYSQLAIVYRKKGEQARASQMLATLTRLNDEERRDYHRERLHAIEQPLAGESAQ